MEGDDTFRGGGTSIDSLRQQPQQQNPQMQQPQMTQEQYQAMMQQQQMQQMQQMQQQHINPMQHQQQVQNYPRGPPRKPQKREKFGDNGGSSYRWKEVLLVFGLCAIFMNYQVYRLEIPRMNIKYEWIVATFINALIVSVLYFVLSTYVIDKY